MQNGSGPTRLQFARFVFDRASRELYCDGSRVQLQEQPALVLTALLDRPGDIITREDLRERLWPSDTFVDFDHGLNTAVKKIRRALGDSAETPSFVETVPRRGYRFIAPVRLLPPAPAPAGVAVAVVAPPLPVPTRAPHRSRRRALWIAAVAMALLGGLAWQVRMAPEELANPGPGARTRTQLAVMPFRVLSPASEDAGYLGIGLADAITTRLAATRQVGVRPTSVVARSSASTADPAGLAAALGVEHLLVGTIQLADQTYRVTVQLVRADGVAVWGSTYDEPRTALLMLQDRLAEHVVSALRIELAASDRARLHVRYTNNPDAYDRYLRGRSLLLNYTEANMRSAIQHFEQALHLDRNYALAHAGIATASAWFSVRYAHRAEEYDWAKRADEQATRALALDGSLAEAHLAGASAAGTPFGGYDWTAVLTRTTDALALDPSLEFAHLARMRAYYHLGLFEAAAREGGEATRLNPDNSVEFERLDVAVLLFGGEFAQAVARAQALLQRTDAPAVRHYLGLALYYTGNADGGRAMLESIKRGSTPDLRSQASLASIEAGSGRRTEARARLAQILAASEVDHHVAYSVGAALAQLGDGSASVEWLERAADTGFPCYPWFARDPLLDPVRLQPRFVKLLARLQAADGAARRLQP
jgi:DNA-binding winged helix-turn-helix (wHTH) protein/TolB-like protein